ncbi:MAG: hypothetical protein Q9159_005416 [Coniocarpon cinnabarinum]
MAAALHHVSMLPTIKCSNCGSEIEISMVGEHSCTDKQPSTVSIEQVPALTPFAPPKHSSPLYQVEFQDDDDVRSRSPSPILSNTLRTQPQKPASIDTSAAYDVHDYAEPPTPAESLIVPDITPTSSNSEDRSPSLLEPPQSSTTPQFPTPITEPQTASQSRPSSPDLFGRPQPKLQQPTFPTTLSQQRPRSPLSQFSYVADPGPQANPGAPPPLRVSIPPHGRQASGSSLSAAPHERHRKSPSLEKQKRQSGGSAEEKKILGLFRRKSSKSVSKKNVSSPIVGPNDRVPEIPCLPIGSHPNNLSMASASIGTSVVPGSRALPTGPAPPRPARPESLDDVTDPTHAVSAAALTPAGDSARRPPVAPALPPPPQPTLPNLPEAPRGRSFEMQRQQRNSDASVYGELNASPERPLQNPAGLPQISEEDDTPASAPDASRPPSAWPGDRLRASSGSRHTASESTSSNGSRFGFDDRSTSSVSSPPTSSASSFQSKDLSDEPRTITSFSSEPSTVSPRIGTSPRTANFSRPRAPTVNTSPDPAGPLPSPGFRGFSTSVDSPSEPATPNERSFESVEQTNPAQLAPPRAHLQAPTLQPVSYQRGPAPPKPTSQPFVRPPLPPMPEEPRQEPSRRPNLSRSKSTASKGQCRGCNQDITGKSVKAADGRLTGRWHKECFSCKTCKSPFLTADFYVLRDEPYCSHHYHMLNNSLCRSCHTGIEGRYFEIDGRRRFHTGCFACADCRRPLAGDYFEMANRFYCEVDAQRFHQRTHHLNPGRRFPERRTTKLMEM